MCSYLIFAVRVDFCVKKEALKGRRTCNSWRKWQFLVPLAQRSMINTHPHHSTVWCKIMDWLVLVVGWCAVVESSSSSLFLVAFPLTVLFSDLLNHLTFACVHAFCSAGHSCFQDAKNRLAGAVTPHQEQMTGEKVCPSTAVRKCVVASLREKRQHRPQAVRTIVSAS
jgi:hypothetical protein